MINGNEEIIEEKNDNTVPIVTLFSDIPLAKETEIHAAQKSFDADPNPNKVNLCRYGAFENTYVNSFVTPMDEYSHKIPNILKLANKILADDRTLNKEYSEELGPYSFSKAAMDLVLGKHSSTISQNKAFAIQTISQVGALRILGEFCVKVLGKTTYYCSDPVIDVFHTILAAAGMHDARSYRYWDGNTLSLDINGLLEDLSNALPGSLVILNVCGHNPTGCDPSNEQWMEICKTVQKHHLIPVMDIAYQGLISGDPDVDAWPIRHFVDQGLELFCVQSFARNMGLFGDRIGSLIVVLESSQYMAPVKSQLRQIVSALYLCPPNHSARLVTFLINDTDFVNDWKDHLKMTATRLMKLRRQFREALERTAAPGNWSHITNQKGLFSYTGLSEAACIYLQQKYHVYLLKSGKISFVGLNSFNIYYVAKAISETLFQMKSKSLPSYFK